MHSQISAGNMYKVEDVKNIEIDFNTFNQLKLGKSGNSNTIAVYCTNCTDESLPKVDKNGAVMSITVPKEKEIPNTHQNKFRAGQPLYPDYEINLPKDFDVIVNYEKGNFIAEDFEGDLKLNLSYGKISINKFKGNITIASYNGIIDCNVNSGLIAVENSKGEIVSNLKDKNLKKEPHSLKGKYKNDANSLTIKTVEAKVILNPEKTQ